MWKALTNASSQVIKAGDDVLNRCCDFNYVLIKMLCVKKSRKKFLNVCYFLFPWVNEINRKWWRFSVSCQILLLGLHLAFRVWCLSSVWEKLSKEIHVSLDGMAWLFFCHLGDINRCSHLCSRLGIPRWHRLWWCCFSLLSSTCHGPHILFCEGRGENLSV